jgi:hypothetical protein
VAKSNDTVSQLGIIAVICTLLKKNIAFTGFRSFSEANLKETSCKSKTQNQQGSKYVIE